MQKTAGRWYTQQGGPAGYRKGGPPDCRRVQKRAGRRDKRLKLAKVIVFKACGSCNERPAPTYLLHSPSARLNIIGSPLACPGCCVGRWPAET